MSFDPYFALIQEEALPGVWSRGVALARDRAVILESRSDTEFRCRVKAPGKTVSPSVTLWPEDEDSHCDCGDRVEPCMHIVAAAVAIKNNWAQAPDLAEKLRHPQLQYRMSSRDGALTFERVIVFPSGEEKTLRESLVSYVGGIGSGRIAAPELSTTKLDYRVDQTLSQLSAQGWLAGNGLLDRRGIPPLFDALKELPGVLLDGAPIRVSAHPLKPESRIEDTARGVRLRLAPPSSGTSAAQRTFSNDAVLLGDGELRPLTSLPPQILEADGHEFQEREFPLLVNRLLPLLERETRLDLQTRKLPRLEKIPPRILIETFREDSRSDSEQLEVMARLVYGSPPIAEVIDGKIEFIPNKSNLIPERDEVSEQSLLRELQSELHLKPRQRVRWEGADAVDFLKRSKRWQTEGSATRDFSVRGSLEPEISANSSGLKLRFVIKGAAQSGYADGDRVIAAWRKGEKIAPLLDGGWAQIPEAWLNRHMERLEALLALRGSKPTVIEQVQIAEFSADTGGEISPDLACLRDRLVGHQGFPEFKLPSDLKAELRPYQRVGVQWLSYLRSLGMGAMLADDMGLGKTLQTLCALHGRTLIVAPTSVLPSWEEQLRQFRPGLRLSTYYGPSRRLETHADVTLTSYGVLRMDRALLTAEAWDTAVLDEAQQIKNPDSQIARVAHELRASFRIALSGTPIENRIDDLWSQFQFVQRGLLGSREQFKDKWALGMPQIVEDLKRRVRPLILRRMKAEVAPELPPKIETVLYCDLKDSEQSAYRTIFGATQENIVRELEQGKGGAGIIGALEALLRLRQVCADPALVPGLVAPEDLGALSSKLELLRETVEESLGLGHSILIFSQWTSLLDRMEPVIRDLGVEFVRLDGSTRNRSEVIQTFQAEDGPRVLLLSIKAGGVGVTLTKADHVIITDPWWNPAVEDQAADRAHRIGQDKPVLVQRLVARDTVEERILALKKKKLELARAILGGPAEANAGATPTGAHLELTREDLLELLRQ